MNWIPNSPPRCHALELLASRMFDRGLSGREVHLTPTTAMQVALALKEVAAGPITEVALQKTYTHTVQDRTTLGVPQVLAYTRHATIAIGAYDAAIQVYPDHSIVALWGGWTMRKSWE